MPGQEPLTTAASDAALIAAVARGDRPAFETLVRRHQAAVFRFARALSGDATPEDALQETFLAAWRSAGSFRGDGSLRSWLFAIARRAVAREHRRRAGEPEELVPLEPLEDAGRAAGWGAHDPGFLDRLLDRDRIARALAALRPGERAILVLRDVEGLSGAEAAAVLDTTEAAVKVRLHRARLRLAARLKEEDRHGR